MNKAVVIALIVVALAAAGYYFGYDIGYEEAEETHDVPPPAASQEDSNSAMLAEKGEYPIFEEEIEYVSGVKGFYVRPDVKHYVVYPGIVMIHEWWGLNDNIKDMARELGTHGYRVMAVDLFGKVAKTADEARALTGSLDQVKALENLKAAAAYLRSKGAKKIASLGWCFGGGQSLQFALSGEALDATVIYYGRLVTDETQLQEISWPVLGIFGGKDTSIPTATVEAFRDTLTTLGIQNSVHIYPDVGHAFANPSGASYAPDETRDAWAKTLAFLKAHLQAE